MSQYYHSQNGASTLPSTRNGHLYLPRPLSAQKLISNKESFSPPSPGSPTVDIIHYRRITSSNREVGGYASNVNPTNLDVPLFASSSFAAPESHQLLFFIGDALQSPIAMALRVNPVTNEAAGTGHIPSPGDISFSGKWVRNVILKARNKMSGFAHEWELRLEWGELKGALTGTAHWDGNVSRCYFYEVPETAYRRVCDEFALPLFGSPLKAAALPDSQLIYTFGEVWGARVLFDLFSFHGSVRGEGVDAASGRITLSGFCEADPYDGATVLHLEVLGAFWEGSARRLRLRFEADTGRLCGESDQSPATPSGAATLLRVPFSVYHSLRADAEKRALASNTAAAEVLVLKKLTAGESVSFSGNTEAKEAASQREGGSLSSSGVAQRGAPAREEREEEGSFSPKRVSESPSSPPKQTLSVSPSPPPPPSSCKEVGNPPAVAVAVVVAAAAAASATPTDTELFASGVTVWPCGVVGPASNTGIGSNGEKVSLGDPRDVPGGCLVVRLTHQMPHLSTLSLEPPHTASTSASVLSPPSPASSSSSTLPPTTDPVAAWLGVPTKVLSKEVQGVFARQGPSGKTPVTRVAHVATYQAPRRGVRRRLPGDEDTGRNSNNNNNNNNNNTSVLEDSSSSSSSSQAGQAGGDDPPSRQLPSPSRLGRRFQVADTTPEFDALVNCLETEGPLVARELQALRSGGGAGGSPAMASPRWACWCFPTPTCHYARAGGGSGEDDGDEEAPVPPLRTRVTKDTASLLSSGRYPRATNAWRECLEEVATLVKVDASTTPGSTSSSNNSGHGAMSSPPSSPSLSPSLSPTAAGGVGGTRAVQRVVSTRGSLGAVFSPLVATTTPAGFHGVLLRVREFVDFWGARSDNPPWLRRALVVLAGTKELVALANELEAAAEEKTAAAAIAAASAQEEIRDTGARSLGYGSNTVQVAHVLAPDFSAAKWFAHPKPWRQAVETLACTYEAVLEAFADSKQRVLRLPPLLLQPQAGSSGHRQSSSHGSPQPTLGAGLGSEFSTREAAGPFVRDVPRLTFEALQVAFQRLKPSARAHLTRQADSAPLFSPAFTSSLFPSSPPPSSPLPPPSPQLHGGGGGGGGGAKRGAPTRRVEVQLCAHGESEVFVRAGFARQPRPVLDHNTPPPSPPHPPLHSPQPQPQPKTPVESSRDRGSFRAFSRGLSPPLLSPSSSPSSPSSSPSSIAMYRAAASAATTAALERDSAAESIAAAAAGGGGGGGELEEELDDDEEEEAVWPCPLCTVHNPLSTVSCEVCAEERPTEHSPESRAKASRAFKAQGGKGAPRRGLSNLGQTCFLNAAVQLLAANADLRKLLSLPLALSSPSPSASAYFPASLTEAAVGGNRGEEGFRRNRSAAERRGDKERHLRSQEKVEKQRGLVLALRRVFAAGENRACSVSPAPLASEPAVSAPLPSLHRSLPNPFNGHLQEDAADLLQSGLLDALVETWPSSPSPSSSSPAATGRCGGKNDSNRMDVSGISSRSSSTGNNNVDNTNNGVEGLYGVSYETRVRCLTCGQGQHVPPTETHTLLPLALPSGHRSSSSNNNDNDDSWRGGGRGSSSSSSSVSGGFATLSVDGVVALFLAPELVEGYQCDHCFALKCEREQYAHNPRQGPRRHRPAANGGEEDTRQQQQPLGMVAERRTVLTRAPPHLMVSLTRFKHDGTKNVAPVRFSLTLNLPVLLPRPDSHHSSAGYAGHASERNDYSALGGSTVGCGGGGGANTTNVAYALYAVVVHESAPVEEDGRPRWHSEEQSPPQKVGGNGGGVASSLRGLQRWAQGGAGTTTTGAEDALAVYSRDRGHYYCYARDSGSFAAEGRSTSLSRDISDQGSGGGAPWYRYDDGTVSLASEEEVLALGANKSLASEGCLATPYIFAYRRIDDHSPQDAETSSLHSLDTAKFTPIQGCGSDIGQADISVVGVSPPGSIPRALTPALAHSLGELPW